ncbi:predicted protein [Uncinocarpus reesii 1704]|uniref:GPI mannosyltransferase 2 n=1 Tax=Uncinocarpus reesii (strain UAMH 1704) TaxID=336963 RepID=C4JS49_UNCRE|nr:uncharacterized protein UREG_05288 [Uncinocarpus reesii 1704]EEP80446.1 predicted protein [Uncinocarpus reesii 1704]
MVCLVEDLTPAGHVDGSGPGTLGVPREPLDLAIAGIALSHICHYLSVLVLFALTKKVFDGTDKCARSLPVLAAALHIVCPAGAFLSAPYGEALFSLLNFLGFYIYVLALRDERGGFLFPRDVKFVTAGCIFAAATTVRSNGILSGLLFAYDALSSVIEIVQARSLKWSGIRRLISIVLGGSVILLGTTAPQYIAYSQYCQAASPPRSWCTNTFPSIYAWVQSHYWWALDPPTARGTHHEFTQACLARLALPPAMLAVLAITSYHVQIINRVASGYPVLYWWLASAFLGYGSKESYLLKPRHVLSGMVMYGIVQASLFASFLPPA